MLFRSMGLLCIFIFFNRYFEVKNDKSIIEYFREPKSLTNEEKLWISKNEPLVFGAIDTNAPFFITNGSEDLKGLMVDYLNELSKEIGMEIQLKTLTAEEVQGSIINGDVDFTEMIPSLNKDQYYEFTYPIFRTRGILVLSQNTENIVSYNQLNNRKIHVRNGDYAEEIGRASCRERV